MANAAVQNTAYHGQAYMLLCDNTALDYGDVQTAESFAEQCAAAGFCTVSMRDDFLTIYGENVHMVPAEEEVPAAEASAAEGLTAEEIPAEVGEIPAGEALLPAA